MDDIFLDKLLQVTVLVVGILMSCTGTAMALSGG